MIHSVSKIFSWKCHSYVKDVSYQNYKNYVEEDSDIELNIYIAVTQCLKFTKLLFLSINPALPTEMHVDMGMPEIKE